MGQQSILHAVKTRSQPISKRSLNLPSSASIAEENEENDIPKPLAKALSDLKFTESSSNNPNTNKGKPSFNQTAIYTYIIIPLFLLLF